MGRRNGGSEIGVDRRLGVMRNEGERIGETISRIFHRSVGHGRFVERRIIDEGSYGRTRHRSWRESSAGEIRGSERLGRTRESGCRVRCDGRDVERNRLRLRLEVGESSRSGRRHIRVREGIGRGSSKFSRFRRWR